MNTEITKTEMKNQVMTNQTQSLAGVVPTDVVVPRILLMQPTSDFVHERKAQAGDLVRSTTVEKIGEPGKTLEFIPLSLPVASWVIEVKQPNASKFEFKRIEPRTASNGNLPWSFRVDLQGNEVPAGTPNSLEARRVQRLSLFAILPSDIDAEIAEKKKAEKGGFPDFSKALMPVEIGFRSTSFRAGREVLSFFTQAASFKQPAWKAILKLTCHQEQNDKGTYYVMDVDRSKPTPVKEAHLPMVSHWAEIVNTQNVTVDEVLEETDVATPVAGKQF